MLCACGRWACTLNDRRPVPPRERSPLRVPRKKRWESYRASHQRRPTPPPFCRLLPPSLTRTPEDRNTVVTDPTHCEPGTQRAVRLLTAPLPPRRGQRWVQPAARAEIASIFCTCLCRRSLRCRYQGRTMPAHRHIAHSRRGILIARVHTRRWWHSCRGWRNIRRALGGGVWESEGLELCPRPPTHTHHSHRASAPSSPLK